MATIEEIYKKRGIEYKPMPTGIREESSTQKLFLEISAKREQRKREGIFTEAQKSYEEAQKAASLKSIVKETILGIPEAIPKTFKVLATPEGVKSLGRGYIKGLSLGYIAPETPEEATEVEKAIEAGWEAAGFFTAFLGGEAALNLAFKTPVIAAKLGKSAPYIARASAWLGTSQLHKDLRGAEFEERAKQAAIDAATLLIFEGIAYGVGKGITRFKMGKVPPAVHQKGIKYFQSDLKMKFGKTGMNIPEMVKITEGVDLSKAKTITEAIKIYKSKLPTSWLKNIKVKTAIDEAFGTVKSAIFEISKKEVHPLMARFKLPKVKPGVKAPKFMPKPVTKPPKFRVSLKAEMAALRRIQRDFPGIRGISTRISTIEKEIAGVRPKVKVPKAEISELKISKVLPEVSKKPYVVSYKPSAKAVVVKEKFWSLAEAKMRVSKLKMVTMKVKVPPPPGFKPIKAVKLPKARAPEMRELAYYSGRFRRPSSRIVKEEAGKLIRRSDISQRISSRLQIPIRIGKFRRGWGKKAVGVYKPDIEVIRWKEGGVPTISHELGHHLDKILGRLSKALTETEREKLLMEYGRISKKDIKKRKSEAFAEFLRFYITEPEKAKVKAPIFSKYFKKRMEKFPEIKEVLEESKRDYRRWLEMPATAKILSQISMKEAKMGLREKIVDSTDKLYIAAKDDLFPLKQFSALAKKQLGDIPKRELPYVMARVMRGWVGKSNVFLEKGTFNRVFYTEKAGKIVPEFTGKSFKDILKPIERKGGLEDLSIYLVSKRTMELSDRGIKTGVLNYDAMKAISELTKKYPEFPKVAKELYGFQDAVLKYGYQSGLFDAELLAKIRAKNQFYVPFYRVFEELQSRGFYGKGYVNMSNQLKRIKGSEREIINPLESIVKNTYAIISVSDRNAVGIQMANLAARNKELGRLFEKISIPVAKVATVSEKDIGVSLAGFTKSEMEGIVDIFRPSLFLPKDNVVTVLIRGKKYFYQTDPMLYQALAATEKEQMGITIKLLSYPTRWLRAGAILSPEFMIRNPMRDIMSAYVYSKYGFIPPIDFTKGVFSLVGKDKDYWLWRMAGGEHAMFVSMDRTYLKKSFEEIVGGKKYTHYLKNPLEALRILSEMSETPTRLGEFKKGIARMVDPVEAAYASREVTIDFAKMGNTGRVLNRLYAFWNAWAEGWDKLIREFKHHPTKTTAKVVSGITMPSILLYFINRDDPRWKEIPQWQKDLFWIFMTEEHIYRIPKPFELGIIFGSVPERILEYIDEKDPEAMKKLAENILVGTSPGLLPTAFQPLVENWANYNFFLARPVVPISREALPPEAQYTAYTSEVAKILGKTVNYPPAKIDNLFRGYFAGLGRHATETTDKILIGTGISSVIKPEPTLADKPVTKAFVVRRPIGSASESVNKFYDKYHEYESREKMLKEFLRNNEKDKFYAYKEKFPELYFTYDWERKDFYSIPARYYRKMARQIAELRKKEKQIHASKTLTPLEKREKIDRIDELITKVAQKALEFDLRR